MSGTASPVIFMRDERLKAEAAIEPDPVPTSPAAKTTQIIAIYGKGGIGKSFTLANLSYMMAQQGKKVLLIGCDPKSDTTSLLFGGKATPTIIETSSRKKLAGEQVAIGDVCFKRDGVYAMELGGPEVGRGCGGRGIIHGFETLEKLGFHDWGFDYVLLDFLGDAVFKMADPALYDAIVITNLCVPTASGVPLQILPKEINGVRIIGID
ncbi:MAG: AAA family ATPase, partial [Betaproteobacteria bacterium]